MKDRALHVKNFEFCLGQCSTEIILEEKMKKLMLPLMVTLITMLAFVGCPDPDTNGTEKITISYNANGWEGTGVPTGTRTINKGSEIGAANIPTLNNTADQEFMGWATSASGTVITSTFKPTKNVTLFVIWETIVAQTVNITYAANGWKGEDLPDPTTGTAGQAIGAAALPTLDNQPDQRFDGWALSATGNVITAAHILGMSDITLHVIWTEILAPGSPIVIRYNANGFMGQIPDEPYTDAVTAEGIGTGPLQNVSDTATQKFLGWSDEPFGDVIDATFEPINDFILYVVWEWIPYVEKIWLNNGATMLYKFVLPEGSVWEDYASLSVELKVDADTLALLNDGGLRMFRLYGAYNASHIAQVATDRFDLPVLNLNNFNAGWIMDNSKNSATDAGVATWVADTWINVTFDISGAAAHAQFTNMPAPDATGPFWFGIGLSGQGGPNSAGITQLVRNVLLNGYPGVAHPVLGAIPDDGEPVAVGFIDPWVHVWRGGENDPVEYPTPPPVDFDRGDPPAIETLNRVDLGAAFTYVNTGNPNNQAGWVSSEEDGQANDQNASATSDVSVEDFVNAWYLVIEATDYIRGGSSIVWGNENNGWKSANLTTGAGAPMDEDAFTIEEDNGKFIMTILLPEALLDYEDYFTETEEWAMLAFSYWGPDGANMSNLGITAAYLLVEDDLEEVVIDNPTITLFGSATNLADDTIISIAANKFSVNMGPRDFNASNSIPCGECAECVAEGTCADRLSGIWGGGGLSFAIPDNWARFSLIKVEYTATVFTDGMKTAQIAPKQGLNSFSGDLAPVGLNRWPSILDGDNEFVFATKADLGSTHPLDPTRTTGNGISFQVNAWDGGNAPQMWDIIITKITLIP
jgi:hypothetical protein